MADPKVVPFPAEEPRPAPGFTIITGLSGAGRSETAHSFEDLGYFVVDNLPPALLPKMAELASRPGGPARVAIVVDARGGIVETLEPPVDTKAGSDARSKRNAPPPEVHEGREALEDVFD